MPRREPPPRPLGIRPGRRADAPALTRIARAAKASRGYPEAWLAEWREALTFTPESASTGLVWVAELEGSAVGVAALEDGAHGPSVAHLWVDPEHHGRGVGGALLDHALARARERGWTSLRVESDPGAVGFYGRYGAGVVGRIPAPVAGTDRHLPVLRLPVPP